MGRRGTSLVVLGCTLVAAVGFVGFVDDRPDVPLEQALPEGLLPTSWEVDIPPEYIHQRLGADRKYLAIFDRDDGFELRLSVSEFSSPARALYETYIGTRSGAWERVKPSLPPLQADTLMVEQARCDSSKQVCEFRSYTLRFGQYVAALTAVAPYGETLPSAFVEDHVVAWDSHLADLLRD